MNGPTGNGGGENHAFGVSWSADGRFQRAVDRVRNVGLMTGLEESGLRVVVFFAPESPRPTPQEVRLVAGGPKSVRRDELRSWLAAWSPNSRAGRLAPSSIQAVRLGPLVAQMVDQKARPSIDPEGWAVIADRPLPLASEFVFRDGTSFRNSRDLAAYVRSAVVAALYAGALDLGLAKPVPAVALHLDMPLPMIRKAVQMARANGFLTVVGKGVKGGDVTPKALKVLRDIRSFQDGAQ